MSGRGKKDRPLQGAVICCTSVPAEERTQYADFALSMGADHKLDLTSDVTHLLVGDPNTPKYKYVAREREDVRVLRPEWIEAVRNIWIEDASVDLIALEVRYKFPTFAGLTICITGFDDLNFRAQLQQKIDEEGGRYTGDLTKHVTHLVAFKAEGKKYQYAMQWQKQIVTLQWLKDSLERGMQLDETKYHPSIPPEDQGKGAWNREAKYANQLGKRARPQELAAEPSRKLRRTASAKLSSQNDRIWADINSKPEAEQQERELLRPSKSMPVFQPQKLRNPGEAEAASLNKQQPPSDESKAASRQPRISSLSHGFVDECYFAFDEFDARKRGILMDILLGQGGTVVESLKDLLDLQHVRHEKCFLILPHSIGSTTATEVAQRSGRCQIVTELWVEICVEKKQCVTPSTYPLGKLLPCNSAFSGLSINSSGFPGIERNHVAKAVQAMGAKYDEVLKPGVSVLICYSSSSSVDKIRHAKEWKIPVVTASWLWASLKSRAAVPFQEYTITPKAPPRDLEGTKRQARTQVRDSFFNEEQVVGPVHAGDMKHLTDETPTQPLPKKVSAEDLVARERPGSDFQREQYVKAHSAQQATKMTDKGQVTHVRLKDRIDREPDLPRDLPMQETTGNSPPKARSSSPKKRKPLFQTLDGAGSISETDQAKSGPEAILQPGSGSKQDLQTARLLNGAIQDLLNQTGKTRPLTSSALAAQTNKQPLSRALSNVSNASMGSRARASRAGSVSSVNTDGLGSEIAVDSTEASRTASLSRGRGSFTGRAKAKKESQTIQKPSSIELEDLVLYRENFAEEEAAPQLTQLGYEDPEEAIALRAKLAEKRRKRSKAGQEDANPEELVAKPRAERRIHDDDTLLEAKWAGGRRTRHKDKTPPALKGLNDF